MKTPLIELVREIMDVDIRTATGLILAGTVLVDGEPETRVNLAIDSDKSVVSFKKRRELVSRGGHKLEAAFESFDLSVDGYVCVDLGSSTGGFTQVLLNKGAYKVYAVDCGTNQLDYGLRVDPRVVSFENTMAQNLNKEVIKDKIDLCVSDLSFTSSFFIVDHLRNALEIKQFIVLIKPQFEYDRLMSILNLPLEFDGIIRNADLRKKIVDYIQNEFIINRFSISGLIESPIKGSKGNVEYLFYLQCN